MILRWEAEQLDAEQLFYGFIGRIPEFRARHSAVPWRTNDSKVPDCSFTRSDSMKSDLYIGIRRVMLA